MPVQKLPAAAKNRGHWVGALLIKAIQKRARLCAAPMFCGILLFEPCAEGFEVEVEEFLGDQLFED